MKWLVALFFILLLLAIDAYLFHVAFDLLSSALTFSDFETSCRLLIVSLWYFFIATVLLVLVALLAYALLSF